MNSAREVHEVCAFLGSGHLQVAPELGTRWVLQELIRGRFEVPMRARKRRK